LFAYNNGKVRVIPRENPDGNRLDLRRDVGSHYLTAEETFPRDADMDIVTVLKSAIGKKVLITYGDHESKAEGVLTEFDESQYEIEIDHSLRIGTQVIHTVAVLP
jgi:hypothetical protein